MNNDTPKLSQQQTLNFARSVLQRHLALETNGYSCSTEEMLDILLMMAAKRETLESTCAELDLVSSAEAYRRHLRQSLSLDRLDAVEDQLNQVDSRGQRLQGHQ